MYHSTRNFRFLLLSEIPVEFPNTAKGLPKIRIHKVHEIHSNARRLNYSLARDVRNLMAVTFLILDQMLTKINIIIIIVYYANKGSKHTQITQTK